MTSSPKSPPVRVRLESDTPADNLTRSIEAALFTLDEAGRIHRVVLHEHEDVRHVLGVLGTSRGGAFSPARRVQTVARMPLRSNGGEPAKWWRRRAQGIAPSVAAWLAHGSTAARLLVTAGIAGGDRVFCLPLLPPPSSGWPDAATPHAEQTRARLRHELGLAPGVRLAVGAAPRPAGPAGVGWIPSMRSRHRSDLVSGELRRVPAQPGCYALHLRDGTGAWVTGDLGGLLSAADVFVAADTCLTACNPALAAVDAGLPIVAATTDSAQDLVLAGAAVGRLAKPRPDAVAGAVAALVDEGALLRRRIQRAPDARRRTADLAHQLLQVYHQVSPQPVTGGAR